jgi:hypothetical protein
VQCPRFWLLCVDAVCTVRERGTFRGTFWGLFGDFWSVPIWPLTCGDLKIMWT